MSGPAKVLSANDIPYKTNTLMEICSQPLLGSREGVDERSEGVIVSQEEIYLLGSGSRDPCRKLVSQLASQ